MAAEQTNLSQRISSWLENPGNSSDDVTLSDPVRQSMAEANEAAEEVLRRLVGSHHPLLSTTPHKHQ